MLDNPDLSSVQLCRYVKGPDFPTGGEMLNSPEELKEIYKTGSGTIRLRGTWDIGPETRSTRTIYVDSDGRRFVNESNSYMEVGKAMYARDRTSRAVPFGVASAQTIRRPAAIAGMIWSSMVALWPECRPLMATCTMSGMYQISLWPFASSSTTWRMRPSSWPI